MTHSQTSLTLAEQWRVTGRVPCSACGAALTLGVDAHYRYMGPDVPCEWRCPEHCENAEDHARYGMKPMEELPEF